MQQERMDNNDKLKSILAKGGLEEPSFDFTEKVMAKIEQKKVSALVYQPVINSRIWVVSGLLLTVLYSYLLFFSSSQRDASNGLLKYISPVQQLMENLTLSMQPIIAKLSSLTFIVIVLCAGWILFIADKYLRKVIV